MSSSVGLRELRQNASAVLRRVEAGEHIGVTVSGRRVAELVPAAAASWQRGDAVASIWTGADYGPLERDAFDDSPRNPFAAAGPVA